MLARQSGLIGLGLLMFLQVLSTPMAIAEPQCTAETLAEAVDAAGADLRAFTAVAQPRLKEQLAALKEKKGWPEESFEEKGLELIRDTRIEELDEKADELLAKIDTLGRSAPDGTAVSCANQDEVRASASELLAVMRTKAAHITEKLDRELGRLPAASAAVSAPPDKATSEAPEAGRATTSPSERPATSAPVAPQHSSPQPSARPQQSAAHEAPLQESGPDLPWSTTTAEALPQEPYPLEKYPNALPVEGTRFEPDDQGYTIEEIREASRGFFGTISTSLASVIEHAFKKSGRPAAYVLGQEGGGAFIAGLRYGEGTLYLRRGGSQKVYWHGPSIGSDFGAAGSRTLFLIYNLEEPDRLFRRFTGVDGSAYLVGGVGVTFLKGGDVLMAPIRSGLGLRLGANIGYVRFTPRPTWNPF